VDIARAMGLTADEFFAFAYPARNDEPSEAALQLDTLLEELRPSPRPPKASPPLGGLTEDGLDARVMQILRGHFDFFQANQPKPQRKRKT
jgi:hypothetical protein